MSLASRRVIGERLAALYWARKGMRRNPTLMTVCGLNPAKRAPLRSRLGETGRELGGTALRSIVGAAASFAAAPLIKKLAGSALANPAFRKKFAAFPSERKKICRHTHMPYSGSIPCTGVRRCTMCGATEDQIRRPRKRNPGTVGSALLAGATSAVVGRMLRNPGRTWACDVAVPGVFRGGRGRIFVSASDAADAKRTAQDTLMHDYGMGQVIRVAPAGSGLGLKRNPSVSMPPDLRGAVEAAARSGVYSAVPYAQLLLSGDTMYDDPMGTLLYLKSNLSYWRGPEAAAAKAVIAKYAKKPVRTWMSNPCGSRSRSNPHCVKCGIRLKPGEGFQGMCSFCVREGKNPCGSRYRANPHIVIDSNGLEVESIHRGHPTKTFNVAYASAQKHARTLGREFYVVAHPYVPVGWKHGSIVNPMFFAQGPYIGVKPDGRYVDYKTYSIPAAVSSRVIQKFGPRPIQPPRMNPGPSRKSTVPIAKFAGWVKSQRNPALMADFRKKVAAYKKWTHGSLPTKVSVEKINSPGLNGMIIATGLGKQPESTYIMPGGSKRGGAWKHKWETMPDMADAGNGLLVTKLRGKSRVTNFFHK